MKPVIVRTANMHRLPAAILGGNARHAHWAKRYRHEQDDKNSWMPHLIMSGNKLRGMNEPPLLGLIDNPGLSISLHYPKGEPMMDMDNAMAALKGLIDLTQCSNPERNIGFLGWVRNDKHYEDRITLSIRHAADDIPRTVMELQSWAQ